MLSLIQDEMKTKLTPELAELVGIILGDGHLHTKFNRITIVGSLEDYYYYKKRVMPLFEELFGIRPILKRRNDRNAYYLRLEKKEIFEIFTKEIGLIRGNKKNAHVPQCILRNRELLLFFLRGLFDTDGCLKFSMQNKNLNYYPRVRLAFKKSKFAKEIGIAIRKLDFNLGAWEESRINGLLAYEISGKNNLARWFGLIKPSNPVHISKYLFWKKFGHYIPKSTLKQRLKALNLKISDFS